MPSRFGMRPRKRPAAARPTGRVRGSPANAASSPTEASANTPRNIPRRQPWWERFRPLFERELAAARELRLTARVGEWPLDVAAARVEERLIVVGRVRVRAARPGKAERWHGADFEFSYPPDYPFDKIDVRPSDARFRGRRHQTANGNLCFMQEELEPWAAGYGIERAVEGARDFLRAEVTGVFSDEVPAAELIAYLPRETEYVRAVLLPPHAVWTEPPAIAGTMKLQWDRWGEQPALALFGAPAPAPVGYEERDIAETTGRLWEALRLRHNPVRPNKFSEITGHWFALAAEPPPFSDFAGLEAVLREHAGISTERFDQLLEAALTKDVRERGWLPIALNYPRRTSADAAVTAGSRREWLFVSIEWPKLVEDRVRKNRLRAGIIRPRLEVRGVPSYGVGPHDLARRVGSLYPQEPLTKVRVVIVGLGALGSTIARSLAAAGVGDFVLVDPDVVKPGNVARHEARLPDVGRGKVQAMHQILRETNPHVRVSTLSGTRADSAAFETTLLDPALRPALVVAAVALKSVDGQIDDVARRASPPLSVLHAWVTAEAQVMRAFVTIAGRTACLYCNGLHERSNQVSYVAAPNVQARPFFEASCVDPAFPGAGNANALAAHVIAEMALDVLHDRLPDDQSHWVFAGNRVRSIEPDYSVAPLTVTRCGFRPHPECPLCSTAELTAPADPADEESLRKIVKGLREAR